MIVMITWKLRKIKGSIYYIIKDGNKILEKQWISTGLKDTSENIKKASEMRSRLLNIKEAKSTDRNISLSEYADGFLKKN